VIKMGTYSNTTGSPDELAKPILGQKPDGTFEYQYLDNIHNASSSIDVIHAQIHKGNVYTAGHLFVSVASAAIATFLISVPAATYPHMIISVAALGNSLVQFYEGTTTSSDGTAVTIFNRNRNSANTSGTTLFYTPSVTADGTELAPDYIFGGSKSKAGGGEGGFDSEYVLKPSTKYLVKITNQSGAVENIIISPTWYEIP